MARVEKRPLAEADLDDIWWYIAQDNPDAADKMLDRLEERCTALAEFPLTGMSREELFPSLALFQQRYVNSHRNAREITF
jgi:toxin ParE1/3/4